jgi:peptidylprolyl isomerase
VILAAGHGSRPDIGDTVLVHYEVWLEGDLIDSSLDRGEPFQTPVGVGRNIQGFDEGVLLMQVGARYRLIVPPELAYGDSGAGDVIPPGATLEFEVKLVQILDR